MVISCEKWVTLALPPCGLGPAVEKLLGLLLVKIEFGTDGFGVTAIETVFRELLLLRKTDVSVSLIVGPAEVVDAFLSL